MSFYDLEFKMLAADFKKSLIKKDKGQLWVGNSLQVCEWEAPFQKRLAHMCIYKDNVRILEVGYGFGMASNVFAESDNVVCHCLIEAHPKIFECAIKKIGDKSKFIGVYAFWENVIAKIPKDFFHAVLFDAYLPLCDNRATDMYDPITIKKYLTESLPKYSKIISAGGCLTFVDTTNLVVFNKDELFALGYKSMVREKFIINIPNNISYAKGGFVTLCRLECL